MAHRSVGGDLLVVVPSRGRPHNIARLREAMGQTCRGDTTLLVGLDADDPALPGYAPGACAVRGGLRQAVAWINELAVPRAGSYRFTGHIGDDNVPRTVGWDVRIMEALGKTPFAFANDLYPLRAPGSLACHIFCRSAVVRALGYLGPPMLRHQYVDNAWTAWGQATGITFLEDVIIEHMHWGAGKASTDDSYRESAACLQEDAANFAAYCSDPEGLARDIRKIRDTASGG